MSLRIRSGKSAVAMLIAAIVAAALPPGASARDPVSSTIANEEATSRPSWARLAEFDRAMRENAILDVDVGSVATKEDRALAALIKQRSREEGEDEGGT